MKATFRKVVRSLHGYIHETAGVLMAYFDSAAQAQQAAKMFPNAHVCGTQLIIEL